MNHYVGQHRVAVYKREEIGMKGMARMKEVGGGLQNLQV